jgi:SAM-dependent methyltransferase
MKNFVKTLNKMGYMTTYIDLITRAFINHALISKSSLEIGAAYGATAKQALSSGVKNLIVNDLDERHLDQLNKELNDQERANVVLKPGRFPQDLDFPSQSIEAILASRIVHILEPKDFIEGIRKIHDWLIPGGKAYIVVDTPFLGILKEFQPIYQKNIQIKARWPGYIEDTSLYAKERRDDIPKSVNFMDLETLSKSFQENNFLIEKKYYIPRPDFPEDLQLDQRESAGIIAVKI